MNNRTSMEWLRDIFRIRRIMQHNRRHSDPLVYMFLDFDGVINVFCEPGSPEYEKAVNNGDFDFADRDIVKRLNRFYHDYPVRVVISSSWRYGGLDYCREYLLKAGMDPELSFYDVTGMNLPLTRENEIANYLLEHTDYCGFIVFDDIHMPHLISYQVETNPMKGWTEEKDFEARKKISGFLK